jgi:hypothetical protein
VSERASPVRGERSRAAEEHEQDDERSAKEQVGHSELYEIRVHGVSGTPPAAMLQVPNAVRVAGDATAGFYQPATASTARPDPQPGDLVEAYSWSGLTSGSRLRALWLLLLPYMLVNVAYYAAAEPLTAAGRGRRLHTTLLRLLALSLTFTFVLSVVSVSMDLVAWQYLRPGRQVTQPLLQWMRWQWLNHPQRQLALTAAVPVVSVGLLWWLAHQTWSRTERTSVPPARVDAHDTPLGDRAMFNGRGPVRKLRSVHVTGGFAVVAATLLLPEWHRPRTPLRDAAGRGGGLGVLTVLVVAVLVLVVVLVCLPSMSDRERPGDDAPSERDVYAVLPWVSLALALGVGTFVWFSPAFDAAWPGAATAGDLPGYDVAVVWLFTAQGVLLIGSAALAWWQRQGGKRRAAWGGFAVTGFAATGWLISGGFGAALMLAVARVLGSPAAAGRVNSARDLIVPTSYFWTSAAALGAALVLVPVLGWLFWRWRAASAALRPRIPGVYGRPGGPDSAARSAAIARAWARAALTDRLLSAAGGLLAGVVALVTACAVGYGLDHEWILDHLSWAVTFGVLALAGLAVLLVQIGRRAYSSRGERRTVGILWDLGTFWPRAVHPLAPPCYSERTLPDLLRRIEFRRADAPVVLSCHSQGTAIGAAAVLQLGSTARLGLVTYGSPLRRLYAPIFPAYFGAEALDCVKDALADRWRNLYRSSDPIGGYVFADRFGRPGPSERIDWWLLDPVFARPPGDGSWPPTLAHGDYFADPAYGQARDQVAGILRS